MIKDKVSFKEAIYELAFGDNAINKEFSEKEVIKKIKEFSDLALENEEIFDVAKWSRDDIKMKCVKFKDDDFIDSVIDTLENRFDAEMGINWDVIEDAIMDTQEEVES